MTRIRAANTTASRRVPSSLGWVGAVLPQQEHLFNIHLSLRKSGVNEVTFSIYNKSISRNPSPSDYCPVFPSASDFPVSCSYLSFDKTQTGLRNMKISNHKPVSLPSVFLLLLLLVSLAKIHHCE